jgi:hypothetical protein
MHESFKQAVETSSTRAKDALDHLVTALDGFVDKDVYKAKDALDKAKDALDDALGLDDYDAKTPPQDVLVIVLANVKHALIHIEQGQGGRDVGFIEQAPFASAQADTQRAYDILKNAKPAQTSIEHALALVASGKQAQDAQAPLDHIEHAKTMLTRALHFLDYAQNDLGSILDFAGDTPQDRQSAFNAANFWLTKALGLITGNAQAQDTIKQAQANIEQDTQG